MITHTMSKNADLTPDEWARIAIYALGYGALHILDTVDKEAGHGVALMAADEVELCKEAVTRRLRGLAHNWDIQEICDEY